MLEYIYRRILSGSQNYGFRMKQFEHLHQKNSFILTQNISILFTCGDSLMFVAKAIKNF
jgi:hypothetical protein